MAAGIYIHVPFCVSKCSYCDFYSLGYTPDLADRYTIKILSEINRWGSVLQGPADTLYFGGGTPSLLSSKNIKAIIDNCKEQFSLKDAEITLEANPAECLEAYFSDITKAGVNRISLGLQSSAENELRAIGRRHLAEDVESAVLAARSAGINNLSLDVMLGLPKQTMDSLKATLEFALELEPDHISAYILSLEKGTPLYKNQSDFNIPNTDTAAEMYLFTCEFLKKNGFDRYEISNFAKDGKISRHNTKYWTGENYLGLGPAAHSLWNNKRFYYNRDLQQYLSSPIEVEDGIGGGYEERVMLSLRLKSGLSLNSLFADFKNELYISLKSKLIAKAELLERSGLIYFDGDVISLTDKGAVISNSIISELLLALE